MTAEAFTDWEPRGDSAATLVRVQGVLRQYQAQGIVLTLRQLYYQLVAANIIPNDKTSYKRLGDLVSKARMGGHLDWAAIVDRGRQPIIPTEFESVTDLMDVALGAYRLPRQDGQERHVELWVEKDALASVLEPVARAFHVPLQINKGYSSVSAMYDAARRVRERCERLNVTDAVIVYLGDHDPSGEDMVRDVQERLDVFLGGDIDLEVNKLALTIQQVRQYRLPPNPAKVTDSRARAYIAQHGTQSWELDALPPQTLRTMVEGALESLLDLDKIDEIKEREKSDKERLRRAAKRIAGDQ